MKEEDFITIIDACGSFIAGTIKDPQILEQIEIELLKEAKENRHCKELLICYVRLAHEFRRSLERRWG